MRRNVSTVSVVVGVVIVFVVMAVVVHRRHNLPDNGDFFAFSVGSSNNNLNSNSRVNSNDRSSSNMGSSRIRRQVLDTTAGFYYDHDFTWSIFITPQGFSGAPKKMQTRAIESWLRLNPKPKIVLVGQGEGYEDVAEEYGLEINPHLDLNFILMPLAGSLLDVAMSADTEISVILNSDILLMQSFADGLAKVRAHFSDWFLAGARYDIPEMPSMFEPSRPDFNEAGFVSHVRSQGTLHTAGGQDYFAWNNSGRRLYHGIMPPFIRGKSKFDNWIAHEVIQGRYRDVIDGSEAIVAVHVEHGYKSAAGKHSEGNTGASTFWMKAKSSDWQIFHNINLAIAFGSYRNQDGTTLHAQYKLSSCLEPTGMCLIKRTRPGICPCEHNAFALNTQTDPQIISVSKRHIVKCGSVSVDQSNKYVIPSQALPGKEKQYGLPFTMEELLPVVARNNHVIVTGVSYIYRDVVMNFVCNLRRLGIYDSLILAAFDEEMYKFGFQMGLPIFLYKNDEFAHMSARDLEYGSSAFKKVTKLKSRVVLDILELGYDVTWTDTDITWFKNPLPDLLSMESDFVVQSNAPLPEEKDANGPLRINSGFYRVRSKPSTIVAMKEIISHAKASTMTEQPSFYIVLCGDIKGVNVVGSDKCHFSYKGDGGKNEVLVVQFLDRELYPNGSVNNYWKSLSIIDDFPQLVILHNNWIKGLRAKIERTVTRGLWYYNREKLICSYEEKPMFSFDWSVDVADA
eukprot:m.59689 g.59689  ORF g.59689 m.59689 type:complete len:737 (-) comp11328_c0_seq1:26-2236(-)